MILPALVTTIASTKEQRPPLFRRQRGGAMKETERSEWIQSTPSFHAITVKKKKKLIKKK